MKEELTIGETVKEDFRAARVFSRHGIDFCCGGKKKLSDVCREKHLNEQAIRTELDELIQVQGETGVDFSAMPTDQLCEYIVGKHHAYIKRNAPVIRQYLDKVVRVHGHGYPELSVLKANFPALIDELTMHMMKEENVLFPFISAMAVAVREGNTTEPAMFGSVGNPIRMMEHEHDSAGELLKEMSEATSGYRIPPEACNTFRVLYQSLKEFEEDLHLHIHLENNILFPAALELEKNPVHQ